MENLLSSLLSNTKENAMRSMKSGLATLVAITVHNSRAGNPTAKFVFDSITGKGGIDEFIRTGKMKDYVKSVGKLIYAIKFSDNKEAIAKLVAITPLYTQVVDENKKPIVFQTDEQLEELKATYGENLDFIFADDDVNNSKKKGEIRDRVAVLVGDREEYINQFVDACQPLVGTKYLLTIEAPSNGESFHKLTKISRSK